MTAAPIDNATPAHEIHSGSLRITLAKLWNLARSWLFMQHAERPAA